MSLNTRGLFFSICIACLVLLVGCVDESAEDIDRPEGSKDVVSDAQLDEFLDIGAEVYGGSAPPDIAGTFFFGDVEVIYSSDPSWPGNVDVWCHEEVTYTASDVDDVYDATADSPNCDLEGAGTSSFISGEGDCFTLYNDSSATFEDCDIDSVSILSACFDSAGNMDDPQTANLITSLSGDTCDALVSDGRIPELDAINLTRQENGLAERID